MKKIVLVGYMGCGKSSVGKKLALKRKFSFFDLDELIEKNENLTVNEIFSTKGEIYFRKIENIVLTEVLEIKESIVLSVGGGTPCYFNNHELFNQEGVVSIYLKATAPTLANRLLYEKNTRPLLANLSEVELLDYINKHLFDRSYYYHHAKYVINVDDKSIDQIVSEIICIL